MHIMVYNESFYHCNSFMLEQISYLGNIWFLRFGRKCSWPIRQQGFSINPITLKSAVSHKETLMKYTGFWYVPPTVFSGMAHQVFLIFGTMVSNSNIEKLTEPFFPGKFTFGHNLGKRAQNALKIGFWDFLKNFVMLVFLGNNL